MSEATAAAQTPNDAAQASTVPAQQTQSVPAAQQPQVKSPVSTNPPSILDDAGKTDSDADSKEIRSFLDQAKAEGEQKDGDKAGEKKGDAQSVGAPEKYELKAPEGMAIDEAALKEFEPVARELGLSNEAAQKIADVYAKRVSDLQNNQQQAFNKFVEDSMKETKDAYGPKLKEALTYVAKARDMFVSPSALEKLNASGLANDKDFIQMFEKMGRLISEDKYVEGKTNNGGEITADQLFPSMKQ